MSIGVESITDMYPELDPELEDPIVEDDKPVSTDSADWTVSSLHDKYQRGRIRLQPEYQRQYVWKYKPELPSRLIESLLLDIPVPPVYFADLGGGNMEVIDGQQRLTTLVRFLDGQFALQKLQRLGSLNGKAFAELTDDQQERVRDAQIRSVVIKMGSNTTIKYEVFERLNRGSVALNEQELRNCVYRGPFNDLLHKLESDSYWRKVKGTAEPDPRFVEQEIILRFFAFVDRIDFYKGNLKRFLSDYMASHAPREAHQIAEREEAFRQTMRNIEAVFGISSARLYLGNVEENGPKDGKWDAKFSVSALDIQASALIGQSPQKVQAAAEQIREAYIFYLLTNFQVREAISRAAASTAATKTRWFGFKAEVQTMLSAVHIEPRFFDFDFRRHLYEDAPICKLCGNQIHTLEDATVDHIQPYSKGGKTVPENGQLAHRSCNARKNAKIS